MNKPKSEKVKLLGAVFGCLLVLAASPSGLWADDGLTSSLSDDGDEGNNHAWQAPEPPTEDSHQVQYLLHFGWREGEGQCAGVFSMFDLSIRRKLDESPFGASALLRVSKDFSSSDEPVTLSLREAKATYGLSWLQATAGRFDLQPLLTPLTFFGAYPLMGARRVDGVMGTFPLFFKFGDREDASGSSAPLALGVFYSPSLLSAEAARMDQTQGFCLGQVKCRLKTGDNQVVLRASAGKSKNTLFRYSSLSGNPTVSGSIEWIYKRFCGLCGEWAVQNTEYPRDTGVAAAGFRLERLATVGAFSLDGIYLEAQIPSGRNRNNLFTGGSLFDPASATPPQVCWYVRLKGRWHAVQLEIQATTNQNDYTLARPTAGSMGSGVPDVLGPGRQGGDAGLPLRSPDYKKIAYLGRIGIPF